MYSDFLLKRYRELFDAGTIAGFSAPLRQHLRVNTLRTSGEELVARLEEKGVRLEKVPWVRHGYAVLEAPFSVGSTPEYLLGHYMLQDPSSMLMCEVLDPGDGELVLDMAAAPGGKTSYLAQLMGNGGTIISLELNRQRMRSLRSNLSRLGVLNCISIRMDARKVKELGMRFDRVLLDAPCTGTGTVYKNPEAARKEEEDVEKCSLLQRELLDAAVGVLKEGGTLVYSTCSFLPEENELMIEGALERHALELEDVACGEEAFTEVCGKRLRGEMSRCKRFYPHVHGTQGFFVARMRKA